MIHLNKLDDSNIYTFTIEGNIDEKSAKEFYQLLEEKALKHEKIKLLGSIREFPGFTSLKAFTSTIEMKLKALQNIEKYAILTDRHWVEVFAPIGNFLTPGIPIKKFTLLELEKAIEWLKKEEIEEHPVEVNKLEGHDIFQFTIDGKIDETSVAAMYQILKTHSKNSKISVLGIIKDFDGFDHFKTLIQGFKVDFIAIGKIEKCAIVTDKNWIRKMGTFGDFVTPGMSMKLFKLNEQKEAEDWLKKP